jgi:hypothetical protein
VEFLLVVCVNVKHPPANVGLGVCTLSRWLDVEADGILFHGQVISVQTTYPVEVDVEMKLSTCPLVTAKYSGTLAGIYVAALFAVTTAVEPIVAQIGRVETTRN